MDQMTSACGEANKLLAMVCQVRIISASEKAFDKGVWKAKK